MGTSRRLTSPGLLPFRSFRSFSMQVQLAAILLMCTASRGRRDILEYFCVLGARIPPCCAEMRSLEEHEVKREKCRASGAFVGEST